MDSTLVSLVREGVAGAIEVFKQVAPEVWEMARHAVITGNWMWIIGSIGFVVVSGLLLAAAKMLQLDENLYFIFGIIFIAAIIIAVIAIPTCIYELNNVDFITLKTILNLR